ncbi:hypothetical protein FSP39_001529 [Pinctada imbricata]|uniref:Uncharacterized protein n=1 Tax=Pinctada imbricata TaxID=66713 RepID=A0AA89C4S6_PINIB|nr:hypothetical protein FSP39_001529 [Pinctada imbricata]
MEIRLPLDKLQNIRNKLSWAKQKKKLTLQEIQSIVGLLNFACSVVTPGRTFLRRLIDLTRGLQKPHHRRRLDKEAKADLEAWSLFVEHFNGKALFLDDKWLTSKTLHLYTDASGIGLGGILGEKWFSGKWTSEWANFHISVKELFPIVVAVLLWGIEMTNKRVCFFSENMAVVQVINKQTAKDPHLMKLLRKLIVQCLKLNIYFRAKHVPGIDNVVSDRLSRLQITEFHALAPQMNSVETPIPEWMYKI